MARPRKELDFDALAKLCAILCTKDEICAFFNIDEKTLSARIQEEYGMGFSDYYKKASADGTMSLRRKQFEVAMKGNVTMLIWLGKNILKQSDYVEPPLPPADEPYEEPDSMKLPEGDAEADLAAG